MSHYDDKVLGLVARSDYRPITLKAMSRRFAIPPEDYPDFRSAVKHLVREGKLDVHDVVHELTSVWQKIQRMHMPSAGRSPTPKHLPSGADAYMI